MSFEHKNSSNCFGLRCHSLDSKQIFQGTMCEHAIIGNQYLVIPQHHLNHPTGKDSMWQFPICFHICQMNWGCDSRICDARQLIIGLRVCDMYLGQSRYTSQLEPSNKDRKLHIGWENINTSMFMGKKKDELCKNHGSKYYYDSLLSVRKIHFRIKEPLIWLFLFCLDGSRATTQQRRDLC